MDAVDAITLSYTLFAAAGNRGQAGRARRRRRERRNRGYSRGGSPP